MQNLELKTTNFDSEIMYYEDLVKCKIHNNASKKYKNKKFTIKKDIYGTFSLPDGIKRLSYLFWLIENSKLMS